MPGETYTHDIPVQYRDLDTRSHVNHVTYAAYFEAAKERFYADVLDTALVDAPTVVRTLEVDYRAPIPPDALATVRLGPVEVGGTSLTITYELRVDGDGTLAARGTTVSVYLDDDGRAASLPAAWHEALAPYAAPD